MIEGEFIRHIPCPHCGSENTPANAVYKKGDVYDAYCHSCQTYTPAEQLDWNEEDMEKPTKQVDFEQIEQLQCRGWKDRNIGLKVSDFYRVRSRMEGDNPSHRYYPVTENGCIVGYKRREVENKNFSCAGECKATSEFFGQWLFSQGGRHCVITEGEEDALAFHQALSKSNGGRFITPVVSVSNGSSSLAKQVKANYKWLCSFENVTFMFDNDEAGKKAVDEAVRLLPPGKARIARLTLKDPCEYVQVGRDKELVAAFWGAERYSPAGIVGSSQTWDSLLERARHEKVSLPPFATELSKMMAGGVAMGEITTLAAASSAGKTSVVNEFLYHWIFNSPHRVGIIPLESDLGETTENLLSIHINKKLSFLPDEEKMEVLGTEEVRKAYEELTTLPDGSDRYIILDHQGGLLDEELREKQEYMARVLGCKIMIIDPLTLAMAGRNLSDTNEYLAWLVKFVKNNMISLVNVVHVRKNSSGSKANSAGAEIHEEDIWGASAIFQTSNNNILMMRDKENENERIRNTLKVVMSKCRRTGVTGPAGWWKYNHNTARLEASTDPHGNFDEEETMMDEVGAFEEEKESY